jgi:hypothetical protein
MRRKHRSVTYKPVVKEYTRDYVIRVDGELQDCHGWFEGDTYFSYLRIHPSNFIFYTIGDTFINKCDVSIWCKASTEYHAIEVGDDLCVALEYSFYILDWYSVSKEEEQEVRAFVEKLLKGETND